MLNNGRKALFITFEGPEGAGKSSHADALAAYLENAGFSCVRTREPGGTLLAEKLRALVKGDLGGEHLHSQTELLLMEAARAQHVHELILPALAEGKCVICDRFYDSTTAYQGGARGLDGDIIERLNNFATSGKKPDLTFLMDLPPERGFERIRTREQKDGPYDRFEMEKLDFHRRVRQSFLEIARKEPERVRIINADRPREEVSSEIKQIVDEFIR